MEENYELEITPNALQFIRDHLLPLKLSETHGLVIFNNSPTGGCYNIHTSPLSTLRSVDHYYIPLFDRKYHNYGFDIFIEGIIISGHFLPNPFVLDVKLKSTGETVLEIKNPAFER